MLSQCVVNAFILPLEPTYFSLFIVRVLLKKIVSGNDLEVQLGK